MNILRILLNVGSVITLTLIVVLKEEIIVISLKNIETQRQEIVISTLNHKIPIIFRDLKNYDSHLINSPYEIKYR